MNTKNLFERYATPISIVVAGALVGGGLILSKTMNTSVSTDTTTAPTTEAGVIKKITELPLVKKLGLNKKSLSACITEKATARIVDNDISLGQGAGLKGTPHMVVLMKKDGQDIQFPIFGALPQDVIEKAIAEGKTPAEQQSYVESIAKQEITADDHIQGDITTAPAIIIEYSDIDCPFCKKVHPTLQALVDQGKIAWVYRHSPIPQLHPFAYTKALAAECVAQQKGNTAFWSYLNALVSN